MSSKIIIIDDEQDILTVVTFRLQKQGYTVLTAKNGEEGLKLIRSENPGLIFLDLLMPGVDGYEVAKILKNDEELKDIPLIIFTAIENESINRVLKDTGAEGVLRKPYEPAQLMDYVRQFLPAT